MDRFGLNSEIMRRTIKLSFFLGLLVLGVSFLKDSPAFALPFLEESHPQSVFGRPPTHPDVGMHPQVTEKVTETKGGRRGLASVVEEDQGVDPSQKPGNILDRSGDKAADPSEFKSSLLLKKTLEERQPTQELALIATDSGYMPKTLFVTKNIPVKLFVTAASKKTLCLMVDDFEIRKQVQARKVVEISFVPNREGKFRFYCPVTGMEGAIFVKDLDLVIQARQEEGEGHGAPDNL